MVARKWKIVSGIAGAALALGTGAALAQGDDPAPLSDTTQVSEDSGRSDLADESPDTGDSADSPETDGDSAETAGEDSPDTP